MKRRSFFGTLLALVTAPFVAKAVAPATLCDDWYKDTNIVTHACGAGLKPFATFPADIEAMQTIKANGHDDMLLVLSGGTGYLVDKHGTVTSL